MFGKSDTHPAMDAAQIKGCRQMSSAQRLKMAFEMSETIRILAKAGIENAIPVSPTRNSGNDSGFFCSGENYPSRLMVGTRRRKGIKVKNEKRKG